MNPRIYLTAALCALVPVAGSCRKGAGAGSDHPEPAALIAPELFSNNIGALPGAVYQSQAASPIRWQPWTKETLQHAKDARRLVFCVVALPAYPEFQRMLASLQRDAAVVEEINTCYVPVLIDGDASREMGLLTADLCVEIKRPVQLPLFLWLTHEANPVAWIPVSRADAQGVVGLFNQSHQMVAQMWRESQNYVMRNSSQDNGNRRLRFAQRKNAKVMSDRPAEEVVHCIRRLASLYDANSRSFDEIGGLFPSGSIELLAVAAMQPGLPPEVQARARDTVRELMRDVLPSPMFDPLDGGLFSSRRGSTWLAPNFNRDCPAQARAAVALMQAFRVTRDPQVLERAVGLIRFAEQAYATPEGLFAVGLSAESRPEQWMWSIEEIRQHLAPEDAAWWIKATGMKGLGNLPSEVDPQREFFRRNALGMTQSLAAIAAEQAQSPDAFKPRFEAARSKLLAAREARIGKSSRDDSAHAGASFRMVSAYAAAYATTGDPAYRQRALKLIERARTAFSVGPRLRVFAKDAPASVGAARAFIYALATQAALDVAAITSDEHWLIWSEDLATAAAELFTSDDFLMECPADARLIDVPVTDLAMLFDESTAGTVSSAESRMAELGRPLVASFSRLATPMPTYALDRPVVHTDLLLATMARHFGVTVVAAPDVTPELKQALEQLPLRGVRHRPAKDSGEVPAAAVKVLFANGQSTVAANPAALQEALLPSPTK